MIYRDTPSGGQALVAGVYQKLTVFAQFAGPSSGITADVAGDRLVIVTPGVYLVYFSVSYTKGGTAGQLSHRVFVNGAPAPAVSARNLTFVFFPSSNEGMGILSLSAADTIEVFANPTTAGTTTVQRGQLYAERLDP